MKEDLVVQALGDSDAGVREQALRLAEPFAATSDQVRKGMLPLAKDQTPFVRFQAALSLGEIRGTEVAGALAEILERDVRDTWTVTAVLSSASSQSIELLTRLVQNPNWTTKGTSETHDVLKRLAALMAAQGDESALATCLRTHRGNGGSS